MWIMKLDLVEINKLSPPSLWDLGALSVLISTLLGVIQARVGGSRSEHFYARMVVRLTNELRAKTRENLNMRIKAWVLQCPERIIWVREIIGKAAIRRWHKNRLANYALSKYFGDWQRKWPKGFSRPDNKQSRIFSQRDTPRYRQTNRAYNWKPFALTKIVNVERVLYGQTRHDPQADEMRAAYYKLWGTDIQETPSRTWSQPREERALKPVEFTPHELGRDVREQIESGGVENISTEIIYPPPKTIPKVEQKIEDGNEVEDKPP